MNQQREWGAWTKLGIALLFVYSASAFALGVMGVVQLWNPLNEAVQANQPETVSEATADDGEAEPVTDAVTEDDGPATDPVRFLGFRIEDPTTLVLVFVAIAGVWGSSINSLRAHAKHTAVGSFDLRYWSWYLIRPLVGGAAALALYFVLTAGLITVSNDEVGVLSPAAVAAFSFVAGLASKAAIDRIRQAIESLFGLSDDSTGEPSTQSQDGV